MSSKTIYRKCLPGQTWQRLLPGVVLLHNGTPSQDEKVTAALTYAGPDALLTGAEACRRHGLRTGALPDVSQLHVLVPHQHKIKSAEFVTVERTIRIPPLQLREGFRLAPLVRATTDAARRLRSIEPVERLLVEALQQGRCPPGDIGYELDHGTQRGTAIARRVLAGLVTVRSMAEVRAKALVSELEMPPSHWNVPIWLPGGRYVGCPDAWWDDVALAWEIDSFEFHFERSGYARTLKRNSRYAAAGVTVVQTLPSRLERDPAGVLAELAGALRAASARPRPAVSLRQQVA
ncbi:hypothetical protein OG943_41465 [Amycolatopsis sp. NBC_00345]|uniref:hypothetical protein n=1 Tax=Amycolatopsis sp. NBC_00345 TaxID=2975955 RepID=UPI002E25254C